MHFETDSFIKISGAELNDGKNMGKYHLESKEVFYGRNDLMKVSVKTCFSASYLTSLLGWPASVF